jgi:hypothetical protein
VILPWNRMSAPVSHTPFCAAANHSGTFVRE